MLGEPDSDLHARGSIYSNRCCIHLVLTYKQQKQQQVGQLACEEKGARQYGAWQRRVGCQGKVGQGGAGCQGKAGQSSSATCKLHGSSALENRCAGRAGRSGLLGSSIALLSTMAKSWQCWWSSVCSVQLVLADKHEKQQQVGPLATTATQIGAEPARSKEHGRKEHSKAGQQGAKARQHGSPTELPSGLPIYLLVS